MSQFPPISMLTHEVTGVDLERGADPRDVVDTDVDLEPLNSADVSAVDASSLCELFAREPRSARTQPAGGGADETAPYAMLKPGVAAIHLHYRGPQIDDDGKLPLSGMCTFYLIEVGE